MLSALEALCFDQVGFWVGVVARNGGRSGRVVDGVPFTRLPAGDLLGNLQERFPFLSVTLRQVRRALSRLVDLGLVVRQQFWQSERWRSDYFYTLPTDAEAPENPKVSHVVAQGNQTESPGLPGSYPLLKPLASALPKKTQAEGPLVVEPNSRQAPASRVDTEVVLVQPAATLQPTSTAQPPAFPQRAPQAPSTAYPSAVTTAPTPKGKVWERIHALSAAFQRDSVQSVSPSALVIGGKLHRIDDGACAPLR